MNAILLVALLAGAGPARAQTAVCDGKFHWLYVDGTQCLDGTPTGLEYECQPGQASAPLFILLDSGGACWDGDTCQCPNGPESCTVFLETNHFDKSASYDGLAVADTFWGQEAVFSGPTAAFDQNWNHVRIPYCTGDLHAGNMVQNYVDSTGATIHAHHFGWRNVTHDLVALKSLFPAPNRVVLWGPSAGGYGLACNLGRFSDNWPGVSMSLMQNAFTPLDSVATPMIPQIAQNWGAWRPGKDGGIDALTCPMAIPPGTPKAWSWLGLTYYNHLHYPGIRKAWVDDYSDDTIQFFACALGATPDPDGTCSSTVASQLLQGFSVIGNDPAYHVYFHTGTCHAEVRQIDGNAADGGDPNCDYDVMVQPPSKVIQPCVDSKKGACFRTWVQGFVNNSPAWGNVK
jgi:hypothetical protein